MQILSFGFQKQFDRSRFDDRITLLSLFMAKYKVPWIMKWNYEIETGQVYRARWVKWWHKFDYGKIISLVSSEFLIEHGPMVSPPPTTKALPEIPKNTQSLSNISPSSSLKGKSKLSRSSKTSSSKKKEKSSQLMKMADKLIAEAALLRNDDEEPSLESSNALSQPAKWADYQDAQDSFD
ncbi:hypothetical protein ACFX11_024317 [Malus domestica]